MKRFSGVLALLVMLSLAVLLSGCRSKSKVAPKAAPETSTTGAIDRTIPVSGDDFVSDSGVDPSVDWSDLDELNRTAAMRGWLRDAFFDYDSSTLSTESREALIQSARWLQENPSLILLVEGHCDERGTEQYNLALGERRSNAATQYLATLGVGHDRIRSVSYGEERPFATGTDEDAWSQNRRAHLRVTGRK